MTNEEAIAELERMRREYQAGCVALKQHAADLAKLQARIASLLQRLPQTVDRLERLLAELRDGFEDPADWWKQNEKQEGP